MNRHDCQELWACLVGSWIIQNKRYKIKGFFWKLDKSENESIAGTTV